MASESGSTGKSVVLLKYLDSAWQNSQHHESSRMTLIRLYFFFALAVFIALLLFSTSLRSEIAMFCLPLFLTTYGLSVIRTSIRYKERILRDIRTIYRIHDFLLSSDDQLKEIKSIYYGYRKQEKKKKQVKRVSTIKFIIICITFLSSISFSMWYELYIVAPDYLIMGGIFLAVFFIHFLFIILSERAVGYSV